MACANLTAMLSPSTFFITAVTARHRPIFRRESTASILIDTLVHFRKLHLYSLHEFVVMPDHVHALVTPTPGISLERALDWVKEEFSRCIRARGRVWSPLSHRALNRKWFGTCFEKRWFEKIWFEKTWFDDTPVHDVEDYEIFREHIRMNPVRSGLTNDAHKYRHSSAYQSNGSRLTLDPMPATLEAAFADVSGEALRPLPLYRLDGSPVDDSPINDSPINDSPIGAVAH